jgi:hypothetical protein
MTPRERAEKLQKEFRDKLIANKRPDIVDMLTEAIIEMREEVVLNCPEHPKYNAKRTPRTSCEGCWRYYIDKKDRTNDAPTLIKPGKET